VSHLFDSDVALSSTPSASAEENTCVAVDRRRVWVKRYMSSVICCWPSRGLVARYVLNRGWCCGGWVDILCAIRVFFRIGWVAVRRCGGGDLGALGEGAQDVVRGEEGGTGDEDGERKESGNGFCNLGCS
jgi:hypothetical protein